MAEQPAAETIHVDVVYALPERQDLASLELPAGVTLRMAIDASGLLQRHPQIDLATASVGVFSKASRLDALLRDGDRVEIYRPLLIDPKEVRRLRAAKGKSAKKAPAQRP